MNEVKYRFIQNRDRQFHRRLIALTRADLQGDFGYLTRLVHRLRGGHVNDQFLGLIPHRDAHITNAKRGFAKIDLVFTQRLGDAW